MMRRISFAAAVARAGSLEAVLACLRAGDVMAYHAGLYNKDGRLIRREDDHIPVEWWKTARDINPAAGRAWFRRYIIYDLAIGIELEADAVDALWPPEPEQSQSAPAETPAGMTAPTEKKSAAAAKPSKKRKSGPRHPDWAKIVKQWGPIIESRGPWLNANAAATEILKKQKGLTIDHGTLYRGIPDFFPQWIGLEPKE